MSSAFIYDPEQARNLPTARLRVALGRLDRADEDTAGTALRSAKALLKRYGATFATLTDFVDISRLPITPAELEHDAGADISTLATISEHYAHLISPAAFAWLADLIERREAGAAPSIDDWRRLADLRARLRIAVER